MAEEIAKGSDIELSSDINVITAEINAYQRVAGEAIFEIGRRLKHVKETLMKEKHGEWSEFCGSVNMDVRLANKFIRIVDGLDGKWSTSTTLGFEALYQIATLPPEQREVEHTTAKGETKTPVEMTVKELRDLKRQLKAEQAERERLEQENEELTQTNEELAGKEPEVHVETRTEYVETVPEDYEELKRKAKEYDTITHDRTLDNPYGVELGIRLYEAIDKLSEWQKEFAWIADDVADLREMAKVDTNMKREYDRVRKFWDKLDEIFYDDGVVDAQFFEIK